MLEFQPHRVTLIFSILIPKSWRKTLLHPAWVRLTGAETEHHLDPFSEMPNQLLPTSSIIIPVSVAVILKKLGGAILNRRGAGLTIP